MAAGSWYARVLRRFLLVWFFGVFVSGGAAIALAKMASNVMGRNDVLHRLDEFGQGLVFLSIALMLVEGATFLLLRRALAKPTTDVVHVSLEAPRRTA